MKSGNLNFLEPSGPPQACNGTALPLPLLLWLKDESVHDIVVYNASAPCFLLFTDNSDPDSIIILIQTLLTY